MLRQGQAALVARRLEARDAAQAAAVEEQDAVVAAAAARKAREDALVAKAEARRQRLQDEREAQGIEQGGQEQEPDSAEREAQGRDDDAVAADYARAQANAQKLLRG